MNVVMNSNKSRVGFENLFELHPNNWVFHNRETILVYVRCV